MPCESCNVQFTVFRRKRTCAECKRFYCSNCLTTSKKNSQALLCTRCSIFSKRPLLHSDLLQLKPKDLIFYLQSKHISTTGCVEKDELIRLVLNHVDQNEGNGQQGGNGNNQQARNNPNDSFDSLRQTCQNFFFNITENISDTLASFDGKSTAKTQQDTAQNARECGSNSSNGSNAHIIDQPRVSRREIPTYASSLNTNGHDATTHQSPVTPVTPTMTSPTCTRNPLDNTHRSSSTSDEQKSSTSSSLASPIISVSSIASQGQIQEIEEPPDDENPQLSLNVPKLSDCECSDDEIFASYTARNSLVPKNDADLPQPQTNASASTQTSSTSSSSQNAKQLDVHDVDEISHSSFEELGAAVCGSAVSEDSGGSSNTEPWQIVEPQDAPATNAPVSMENDAAQTQPIVIQETEVPPPPRRKLLRRRSDRQRSAASEEDNSPTSTTAADTHAAELEEQVDLRRRSGTCKRCGKSNLRRYVEKMRRHLESSQMSEADIKREMRDFLAYLEDQTKSVDYSETETTASPLPSEAQHAGGSQVALSPPANLRNTPFFSELYGDNDGIHVYGAEASTSSMAEHNARFVNLEDYENIEDLESLSVKQLKEVLMLHRVDYRGCCEKQELLDRVQRLWKNLKSAPAVERLPTDELCKICMDAPIECVILECGHMATCTNCGKVLSECPICRQYIVRVVRFFRA